MNPPEAYENEALHKNPFFIKCLKFGCSKLLHGKAYKKVIEVRKFLYTLETFHGKNESPLVQQKKYFLLETFAREHYITVHKNSLWWIPLSYGL